MDNLHLFLCKVFDEETKQVIDIEYGFRSEDEAYQWGFDQALNGPFNRSFKVEQEV